MAITFMNRDKALLIGGSIFNHLRCTNAGGWQRSTECIMYIRHRNPHIHTKQNFTQTYSLTEKGRGKQTRILCKPPAAKLTNERIRPVLSTDADYPKSLS